MAYKKKLLTLAVAISSMAITACGTNTADPTSSKGGDTTISSSSQKTTSGQQSTSQTTPTSSSAPEKKKINLDLGDFVANVQDAKSLSIKNTRPTPKGLRKNAVSDDEEPVLVKSSVEYADDGSVVNENGEVEVSFKKITTTTKTTEINGQEAYIPYEDGTRKAEQEVYFVSFDCESDKYYNVYDENDVCIGFWLKDNEQYDLNQATGKIKISVDQKDKEYRLTKFSQSQPVNGVPNCLYVNTVEDSTDLEGNKLYSLSFEAYNAVCEVYDENGVLVFGNIIDGCEEDKNQETGAIKLTGITKKGQYRVYTYSLNDGHTAPSGAGDVSSSAETQEVDAPDYALSFNTNEGFDYKVCNVDGTVLVDNLTDNCEQDLEEKDGVIKVKGFDRGQTYIVKYHGFGEEQEVSQESVGADIDKTYVFSSQFTFISFVPEGESKRPTGDDLVIDSDGVASYDKIDYYSDDYRQSFLMDNYTGLVYKLENFIVTKIENRVLYGSDQKPYGFKINENDELVIFKIVRNETIQYSEVFGNIHNQYYVKTTDFEGTDKSQNTLFFKQESSNYFLCKSGDVLAIKGNFSYVEEVKKVGLNFVESAISDDESILIEKNNYWKIDKGYIYFYSTMGNQITFCRTLLHREDKNPLPVTPKTLGENSNSYVYAGGFNAIARLINYNCVLIYTKIASLDNSPIVEGYPEPYYTENDYYSLYYSYVWEADPNDPNTTSYGAKPDKDGVVSKHCYNGWVKLVDNVIDDGMTMEHFPDTPYDNLKFKQVTFTETIYWKVVMDNGYPEAVNSETYIVPENTSVIIQPINR